MTITLDDVLRQLDFVERRIEQTNVLRPVLRNEYRNEYQMLLQKLRDERAYDELRSRTKWYKHHLLK